MHSARPLVLTSAARSILVSSYRCVGFHIFCHFIAEWPLKDRFVIHSFVTGRRT